MIKLVIFPLLILILVSCSDSSTPLITTKYDKTSPNPTEIPPHVEETTENKFANAFLQIYSNLYRIDIPGISEKKRIEMLENTIELNNKAVKELAIFWALPQIEIKITPGTFPLLGKKYRYNILTIANVSRVDNTRIKKPVINKIIYLAQTQKIQTIIFDPLLSRNGIQGYFQSEPKTLAFAASTLYWVMRGKDLSSTMRHELTHGYFNQKREQGVDSIYHLSFFKRSLLTGEETPDERGYSNYMSAEELYTFANGPYWMNKFDPTIYNATDWTVYFQDMRSRIFGLRQITNLIIPHTTKMKTLLDKFSNDYSSYILWNRFYVSYPQDPRSFYIFHDSDDLIMRYYISPSNTILTSLQNFADDYDLTTTDQIFDFISEIADYFELQELTHEQEQQIAIYEKIINEQQRFYFDALSKINKLQTIATYYKSQLDILMRALNNFGAKAGPYWEILRTENYSDPLYHQKRSHMIELFSNFKKMCREMAMYSREGTNQYNELMENSK